MIRTLVETREGRVTITVIDDSAPSSPLTIDQVQEAVLEADRENLIQELDVAQARVKDLEAQVRAYDQDRKTERDRADQNKAWAERAEANGVRLSEALNKAEQKLSKIQEMVWSRKLDKPMEIKHMPEAIPVETVRELAVAVSFVRSMVGQP